MILVSVQHSTDLQPARALVAAVGTRLALFLLFGSRELQLRFGESACPGGTDLVTCLLNPQNFQLLISFSGRCEARFAANLRLLACFNELGIETVEFQHALFQPGIADEQPDRGGALELGYAARTLLGWGGEAGVGYLGSALQPAPPPAGYGEFVLITEGAAGARAAEKDRYQFAIAVLKLAANRPQLTFVWRSEEAHGSAPSSAAAMVADYALPNVCVEHTAEVASLVAACKAGITTCSTALVEYQLRGKPALVHAGAHAAQLLARVRARSFANATELERCFDELLAQPASHQVDTGLRPLAPERLELRLREAMAGTRLRPDFLPVALAHLPELRAGAADEDMQPAQLSVQLARILQRIGVLQRSTLAYKAKKLASRLLARGGR